MQGISALAIPWFFIKTKGLSSQWGLIYFSITVLIVDKYDRKKILFLNPLLCGIFLTILSSLYYVPGNELIISALCFGIIFFSYSLYFPNLYAICQEMTPSKDYGKVNSILEIQGQFSLIIAGSLAALMMNGASLGHWPVFGFDVDIGLEWDWAYFYSIFCIWSKI